MKRLKQLMLVALVALVMLPGAAMAQQTTTIPVDSAVRVGKLPNGLTYYIRHNDYPKGQAEFYIAQKVGAIVEEDNQRGLAHFLEHMCFNGTKTFEGNNMLKWCESVGIKFGANINAATGIDQTIYNISKVPTARVGVQDTCLIILRDWADGLLLEESEIDSERKVIHEEWRMRMVGQMRILENLLPTIYQGERYGYRLPIGTMEVVDNFPYQALRDYYETWYRPDLQGIMVVGDIDADRIEAKIKELFSDIKMPQNPKKREYYPVKGNEETIYAIGTDKEQPQSILQLMYKHPAFPDSLKTDMNYLAYKYIINMINSMISSRLDEITKSPDAPFAYAQSSNGNFLVSQTIDAQNFIAIAKDNDMIGAYKALLTEVTRVKKHGFLASEYLRARDEYLSGLENAYNNRNQQNSGMLVNDYVSNFLNNEPIPGIENMYNIMNLIAKNLPVDVINQVAMNLIPDNNLVVVVMMPDKEGVTVPTKEQLQQIDKEVAAADIAPFVDNVKTEPLISTLPANGKVVKETIDSRFDAKVWTLSNGVKVIAKKTDFKDDEIIMNAVAKGGYSVLSDKDADNIDFLSLVMSQRSLGTFTANDLEKYLAGKQVRLNCSGEAYGRTISGRTTPKDLNTMMEMLYMTFTALGFDANEFAATQNQYVSILQNQVTNPEFVFQTRLSKAFYKSPFNHMISIEGIKAANFDRCVELAKQGFSNAAEFTFIFSGNFDEAQLKEYVEQYIASLPTEKNKVANVKLAGLGINAGTATQTSTLKMQTPQTYGSFVVSANMPYTSKNAKIASVVSQLLTARFVEQIREKEGATYSVGTMGSMSRMADYNVQYNTTLPMKPEKADRVVEIVKHEFNDLTTNCTDVELNKVKEYMVKTYTEGLKQNSAWVGAISGYQVNEVDTLENAEAIINSITTADVQNFVKEVMKQGNFQIYMMTPEE
ncbi:MAG: M16 family metallopeptidase [Muribaculaceae bacterium]